MIILSAVPYDPALWEQWWQAIMTTIGAASSVGMVVFIAISVLVVFKAVLKFWFR